MPHQRGIHANRKRGRNTETIWGRLPQQSGRDNRFTFLFSADMTHIHLCFQLLHTLAKISQERSGSMQTVGFVKQFRALSVEYIFQKDPVALPFITAS